MLFTTNYAAPNPAVAAIDTINTTLRETLVFNPASCPVSDLEAARLIQAHARTDDAWLSWRVTGARSGEWYAWDGTVHVAVKDELDYQLATGLVDAIEAAFESLDDRPADDPTKKRLATKLGRWTSNNGVSALKTLIRSELRVPQDHFDKPGRFLPMRDGWVLDTARLDGEALAPDPRRRVTRKLGVTTHYEEGDEPGQAPWGWLHWLDQFVPDKGEQAFLQEAAGAALLGRGDAKCIVHLVGPRHTGKTTYLNLISMALGMPDKSGFSGDLANSAIIAKGGGGVNFAQSSAKGVRFLTLSEPSTQQTDDSFLKSISGSRDPIRTERKNQNEERWYAECVLHIAANQVVRFNTRDKAIVQRVNIVEFNNVVTAANDDKDFEVNLFAEEGDGILLWIIEGAKRYLQTGSITIPESIRKRAEDNVVHASTVLRWLTQRVDEGRYEINTRVPMNHMIEPKDGFEDYKAWVIEEGIVRSAHKGQWRDEIQAFTQVPSDKAETKTEGLKRVWGVVDPEVIAEKEHLKAAKREPQATKPVVLPPANLTTPATPITWPRAKRKKSIRSIKSVGPTKPMRPRTPAERDPHTTS